jgi:hypothetical protein
LDENFEWGKSSAGAKSYVWNLLYIWKQHLVTTSSRGENRATRWVYSQFGHARSAKLFDTMKRRAHCKMLLETIALY